jgi:carbamoylphosphate synthase small subunit
MAKVIKETVEEKKLTLKQIIGNQVVDAKKLRTMIRKNGTMKSAIVISEKKGFGPKSRYEFVEGSKEIEEIEKMIALCIIDQDAPIAEKVSKKVKKVSKKAKVIEEVDEDEDLDEDEDDEEDDE